jgi:hypothetical protein
MDKSADVIKLILEHQDRIWAAWLSAGGALVVALLGTITSLVLAARQRRSQKELEERQVDAARKLEELKASLTDRGAESDARRAYEYEARKRLYEQAEPLIFQLLEAAEAALARIQNIAAMCRQGRLDSGGGSGWLASDGYYRTSTAYLLLSPLAFFRILRSRVTMIDLSLDKRIETFYLLAKMLHFTFSADFRLASSGTPLVYTPFDGATAEHVQAKPEIYRRQGMAQGIVETIVGELISRSGNGGEAVMGYGELEERIRTGPASHAHLQILLDLLSTFHPSSSPVLWRILVTQAYLYTALLAVGRSPTARDEAWDQLAKLAQSDYAWSASVAEAATRDDPFTAAQEYLELCFIRANMAVSSGRLQTRARPGGLAEV